MSEFMSCDVFADVVRNGGVVLACTGPNVAMVSVDKLLV